MSNPLTIVDELTLLAAKDINTFVFNESWLNKKSKELVQQHEEEKVTNSEQMKEEPVDIASLEMLLKKLTEARIEKPKVYSMKFEDRLRAHKKELNKEKKRMKKTKKKYSYRRSQSSSSSSFSSSSSKSTDSSSDYSRNKRQSR